MGVILVLAGSLVSWGLILAIGPTILRWLLNLMGSIEPSSPEILCWCIGLILLLIVFENLQKSVSRRKGILYRKYRSNKIKLRRLRKLFEHCLDILFVVGIISSIVIVFNPLWVGLSFVWNDLMESEPEVFRKVSIVGIIFLALGVGFFCGMVYQERRKLARYEIEFLDEEDEDEPETKTDGEGIEDIEDITLPKYSKEKLEEEKNDDKN